MTDDRYPAGYTPPYRLLPYFFGLTFGLTYALAAALGCAVAVVNGKEPRWAWLPFVFAFGFLFYTIVGIVLVEDGRKARPGHARQQRPDYMRQVGNAQYVIPYELPVDVVDAEKWLRQVVHGRANLSQRGAKRAAGLEREDANAMVEYLARRGLWRYRNGTDNQQGGEWTRPDGERFVEMLQRGVGLLDALAHVMLSRDEPPHPDDDDAQ